MSRSDAQLTLCVNSDPIRQVTAKVIRNLQRGSVLALNNEKRAIASIALRNDKVKSSMQKAKVQQVLKMHHFFINFSRYFPPPIIINMVSMVVTRGILYYEVDIFDGGTKPESISGPSMQASVPHLKSGRK